MNLNNEIVSNSSVPTHTRTLKLTRINLGLAFICQKFQREKQKIKTKTKN